jgi:hypothetical protein
MHKSATKCNETLSKWCKNKHGASKIMDTFETYQVPVESSVQGENYSLLIIGDNNVGGDVGEVDGDGRGGDGVNKDGSRGTSLSWKGARTESSIPQKLSSMVHYRKSSLLQQFLLLQPHFVAIKCNIATIFTFVVIGRAYYHACFCNAWQRKSCRGNRYLFPRFSTYCHEYYCCNRPNFL